VQRVIALRGTWQTRESSIKQIDRPYSACTPGLEVVYKLTL
jgi:hypothetical protein